MAPVTRAAPAPGAPGGKAASAAATVTLEGHVITVEEGDLILDLSEKDGLSVGDTLELWRPLKLVHPVTHKLVMDRYRIGAVRLSQVRPSIALAQVLGSPLRPAAAGDVVTIERARASEPEAPEPSGARPSPREAAPPGPAHEVPEATPSGAPGVDPEAHAVSVLFDNLRGASLTTRIRRYERYAAVRPTSRFTRVLLEEAAALRELVSAREKRELDVPARRNFEPPKETLDKTPLTIAVEIGGRVEGAVLQARNQGEVAYQPTPMTPAGAGYFTATLPGDRVVAPHLEYFVEATRPSGESVPIAGSADQPIVTTVHEVPHAAPPLHHESTVTVVTDYADYNRLKTGPGSDHAWQTEGTFGMRFADVGVRAVRSGFGVYRGVGGSLDELDDPVNPRRGRAVGLTYGHLEGEFGFKPAISLIVRAVLGLQNDGTSGGAQLHLRIGSDQSTNLSLGGEVLGGVGLRGITQLEIEPRGRFPVLIRSEVTNQPAGSTSTTSSLGSNVARGQGDIGARAIIQVGYRIGESFVVALRASYQGRTINHAGPGAGGAVEYRW